MTEVDRLGKGLVTVTVELFGTARLAAGQRTVDIEVPPKADRAVVANALESTCPPLIGVAVREDGSDLTESYTLNLNGNEFIEDGAVRLTAGDVLLLFSSQAGG